MRQENHNCTSFMFFNLLQDFALMHNVKIFLISVSFILSKFSSIFDKICNYISNKKGYDVFYQCFSLTERCFREQEFFKKIQYFKRKKTILFVILIKHEEQQNHHSFFDVSHFAKVSLQSNAHIDYKVFKTFFICAMKAAYVGANNSIMSCNSRRTLFLNSDLKSVNNLNVLLWLSARSDECLHFPSHFLICTTNVCCVD